MSMMSSRRVSTLALLGSTALAAMAELSPVRAEETAPPAGQIARPSASYEFALAAGPLGQAMIRFGEITGLRVLVPSDLVRDRSTAGVSGRLAPDQALRQLLSGTGLSGRISEAGTVTLETLPTGGSSMIPTDGSTQLDTITIVGTLQTRYHSRTSETGSRTTTDVSAIPRSVDIIPEQLLQDQHAREMEDVYKTAPNVVLNDGYGGTREDYIIRGFRRRDDIYRDGVRLKTNSRIDPATVDSIQILKGPVADIGQMTPGGLVNIITKKPVFDPRRHVETNFDQYGERQASVDMSSGIGDSKEWAYRLVASYEDSETFRDNTTVKRDLFSPSISWSGQNGVNMTFNYEHGRDRRPLDRGTVVRGNAVADLDRSAVLHAPFSNRDSRYNLGSLDVSVPLKSDAWRLESKFLYSDENTDELHTEITNVNAATGALTGNVQGNSDRNLSQAFARLQLKGEFDPGLPTKLAVGAEYRRQKETWVNFTSAAKAVGSLSAPNLSALNGYTINAKTDRSVEQVDWGPYFQVDVNLTDTVILTLGGRYETSSGGNTIKNLLTGATSLDMKYTPDSHLTKSMGLVWKPVETVSLYMSYADTFQPHNYSNGDTTLFPPEEGQQVEVGAKIGVLDDRLFVTVAAFDIKQENVVESVNGVSQLSGGQRSRGAEAAIVGSPVEGWNIRAAYGALRSAVVSDGATNGNQPTNVPNYTASFWTSYEFHGKRNVLEGLGLGTGVTMVGNRYGDANHSFELGSYTLVDVGAWYYIPLPEERQIRLDFGVKNVTDERYYTASGGTYRVGVGAPRTIFAGTSLDF